MSNYLLGGFGRRITRAIKAGSFLHFFDAHHSVVGDLKLADASNLSLIRSSNRTIETLQLRSAKLAELDAELARKTSALTEIAAIPAGMASPNGTTRKIARIAQAAL